MSGANAQSAGLMSTSPPHQKENPAAGGERSIHAGGAVKGDASEPNPPSIQPVTLEHIIGARFQMAQTPRYFRVGTGRGPRCPPTRFRSPSRLGPLSKRQPERGRKGKRAQAGNAGTGCTMSGRETWCRQTCRCRSDLTLALSRLPTQQKNKIKGEG